MNTHSGVFSPILTNAALQTKVSCGLILLKNSANRKSPQKSRTMFLEIALWRMLFAEWHFRGTIFCRVGYFQPNTDCFNTIGLEPSVSWNYANDSFRRPNVGALGYAAPKAGLSQFRQRLLSGKGSNVARRTAARRLRAESRQLRISDLADPNRLQNRTHPTSSISDATLSGRIFR
jgi:hypothetical protein